MPPITAILRTCNDGLRLGRALETLHPCDEILVVDCKSTDHTRRIAHEYGAKVYVINPGQSPLDLILTARHKWLLFLLPSEALTEGLEATLYEWKLRSEADVTKVAACSVLLREETEAGWSEPCPVTRLIPRGWDRWDGNLPQHQTGALPLEGDLLRFRSP
jgi:hypothetical protein